MAAERFDDTEHTCNTCGAAFASEEGLEAHVHRHHRGFIGRVRDALPI